jgi:hypothetical protein
MALRIIFLVLFFLAGIFFNMALLHMFTFYETQNHPIIKRAKNPYRASKFWGAFQFFCGGIILILCHFRANNLYDRIALGAGFIIWALFLGIFGGKSFKKG